MRGIDSNVLVRYFTADDSPQSKAVDEIIERAHADGERFYVTGLVLCELVDVLSRGYSLDKIASADLLDRLMHLDLFEIENRDLALRALEEFRMGSADFSDYLMAQIGKRAGCRDTLTLDPRLKAERGFTTP
jgi:predicted nucleic-acid-binding protein